MARISGILFDKDGTLFDFYATWGVWTGGLLTELAAGDAEVARRLGAHVGYDMDTRKFRRDSVIIAGTPRDIAEELLPLLPGMTEAALIAVMNLRAAAAPQAEAVPLAPLLKDLRGRGLKLGVATNDAEGPARSHLSAAGSEGAFDFIAGSDSGFGGKPGAGMLLAFAERFALQPDEIVMVGDSRHDLLAGRSAGMRTVAVLTGIALEQDLAPLADVVLPDIGHLPGWLDSELVTPAA